MAEIRCLRFGAWDSVWPLKWTSCSQRSSYIEAAKIGSPNMQFLIWCSYGLHVSAIWTHCVDRRFGARRNAVKSVNKQHFYSILSQPIEWTGPFSCTRLEDLEKASELLVQKLQSPTFEQTNSIGRGLKTPRVNVAKNSKEWSSEQSLWPAGLKHFPSRR